jgi:choloylglycine hydrolase
MPNRLLPLTLTWLTLFTAPALACTDFALQTKDKTFITARTMEWGADLQSRLAIHGRGETRTSKASNGGTALSWTAKHGYVGADACALDAIVDGINEKGLSFGLLWFPQYSQYPAASADAKIVDVTDLGSWILGSFENVAEVKAALETVTVNAGDVASFGGAPTVHMAIHDAGGHHMVVEWIKGKQVIYDNPTGVLTNAPPLDWHLINLSNYIMVNAQNPKPVTIQGTVLNAPGQGGGFLGIPGDWTPPSRFVRTSAMLKFAKPATDTASGITLAQHIVNAVDIPKGDIRTSVDGQEFTDYTQWVLIKDLTNQAIYFRTYDNLNVRKVDLRKLDLSQKDKIQFIHMNGGDAWQALQETKSN